MLFRSLRYVYLFLNDLRRSVSPIESQDLELKPSFHSSHLDQSSIPLKVCIVIYSTPTLDLISHRKNSGPITLSGHPFVFHVFPTVRVPLPGRLRRLSEK